MKTIVITDPCYTDGGKADIDGLRGGGSVMLEVTDKFFEVLKQKPIVVYNEKDNWDGGTYFFGGKFNIDEYDYVDYHFNDAGLTCIADYNNLEAFDWSDFCNKLTEATEEMSTCGACKGTGKKDDAELDKSLMKLLDRQDIAEDVGLDEDRLKSMKILLSKCEYCYGKGKRMGSDLGATMNDHGHFLMVGSTFLGDVGASVWVKREVKREGGEITALAIDVVGYTFGEDEYEDS